MKVAFDINTTEVFMTYPDAGHSAQDILERICRTHTYFRHNAKMMVARETYKNGGYHFHCYVSTPVKHRWTMQQLDLIGDIHGHYKRVTETPNKLIAYLAKDNDYVYHPPSFKSQINIAIHQHADYDQHLPRGLTLLLEDHSNVHGRNFQKHDNKLKGAINKPKIKKTKTQNAINRRPLNSNIKPLNAIILTEAELNEIEDKDDSFWLENKKK